MINIAICDDDQSVCEQIKNFLQEYGINKDIDLEISTFNSGENLISSIKRNNDFSIIYLDISMKAISGVEVGSFIREKMSNQCVQIIYISSFSKYAMELFKTRPLDFLLKPLDKIDIIKTFKLAIKLIDLNCKTYQFKYNRTYKILRLLDILYFTSNNKKICIITMDKKIEYNGKLSEIVKKLGNQGFISIHKSYLINSLYIDEFQNNHIKMINGVELPISQNNRDNVSKYLLNRTNSVGE